MHHLSFVRCIICEAFHCCVFFILLWGLYVLLCFVCLCCWAFCMVLDRVLRLDVLFLSDFCDFVYVVKMFIGYSVLLGIFASV